MKKVLALLSVCAMLSLAACNNATNDKNENDNADTTKVDDAGNTTVETTVTAPADTSHNHTPGDTAHQH